MPLIARDIDVVRLEMPDGDWYELRQALGWYWRKRLDGINAVSLHVPWGQVKHGSISLPASENVPMTLEGMADLQLARMLAYVKEWSHKEQINENTIKRVPPAHAEAILSKIDELERQQDGPTEESPLG